MTLKLQVTRYCLIDPDNDGITFDAIMLYEDELQKVAKITTTDNYLVVPTNTNTKCKLRQIQLKIFILGLFHH